ncbi:MAG TPA: RHS repeat-associated core domain-containing protein [Opitutaceae bacterium]|nr:RHS repeat-associated core domain-containing protein [Opitutaceae bacterium]
MSALLQLGSSSKFGLPATSYGYQPSDQASAYEYDAFGNTLRESGTYAASNPFRFATKYTDIETGLVQYNTRFYSPALGRFINRDTIGEAGGLNLYAYVSNRVPNAYDYLGMNGAWVTYRWTTDAGEESSTQWDPNATEDYDSWTSA